MRNLFILLFFAILSSCVEDTPERLETRQIEDSNKYQKRILEEYPGARIYEYKDRSISYKRFVVITKDSIVLIVETAEPVKGPFDQKIFITRL